MNNVVNISGFQPRPLDSFLVDNNVWMYIYCPIANYERRKQSLYGDFLKSAIQVKSGIFISSLIVSEFCNAWLNLEFENWKKKNPSLIKPSLKKHFKPSVEYSETVSEIKAALTQIFKIANFCSDDFTSISVPSIINQFGKSDFNDSYYIELSSKNKWKIVTDDSDFKDSGSPVTIISANI